MKRHRQHGMTTVEFAIVANVVIVLMLALMELGRAYFVFAALEEVTRRGARLAAVCLVSDPAIRTAAVFNGPGDNSGSRFIPELTPGNIAVEYLDRNSNLVLDPADPAEFIAIRFVRVRVVGFQHRMLIPFVAGIANLDMPEFSTVLPRESLGVPREGAVTPCG